MANVRQRESLADVRHIHSHNRFPSRHPAVSHIFTSPFQL